MNKAILVGRLTADPEATQTSSGVDVCRFTLAINRPYRSANGDTQADFLNIVVWRAAAQNCKRCLKKGSQCAVVGSIQTRSYEDNNGNRRYVTEIVADNVEFLSRSTSSDDESSAPQSEAPAKKATVDTLSPLDDDELPF